MPLDQITLAGASTMLAADKGTTSDILEVEGVSGAAGVLVNPPTALVASTDTSFTFASQVSRIFIQNNTTTPVGFEFDAVASAGSPQLATAPAAIMLAVPVTTVHLYSTVASNVNGTAAGNIVIRGWS